jgi:hypothetical protein
MSIEISNLNPAGSNLFAGEESFLSELKEADSSRVFGGSGYKKRKNKSGSNKSNKSNKRNKSGSNNNGCGYGYGCGCH